MFLAESGLLLMLKSEMIVLIQRKDEPLAAIYIHLDLRLSDFAMHPCDPSASVS